MATKKSKEKASRKPAAKRAPPKSCSKAQSSLGAKPLFKKAKAPAPIDDNEKSKPAKDPSKFPNRFCELMFPLMVERNYHAEHLLAPPDKVAAYILPCIEQRGWEFLLRKSQEVNLSWVVEFYSNYHLPSLQSVYVHRKQVSVSEEAIQQVLNVLPVPSDMDGYQEVLRQREKFGFDWDSILRVIAELETFWTVVDSE
ncbi:uncharacterized protein DS421_9g273460 [Arachis hypogaea]|nr:uncharacterized protein DS421_9g273460 [Arachis hypogaea]